MQSTYGLGFSMEKLDFYNQFPTPSSAVKLIILKQAFLSRTEQTLVFSSILET